MKKTRMIMVFFLLLAASVSGVIAELDSEPHDLADITSLYTVLTDTPDASDDLICQAYIVLGDDIGAGPDRLDGTGGLFRLSMTIGGHTIQPSPQIFNFGTEPESAIWTSQFPVPAGKEVVIKILSPNAGDDEVDVMAYLYDVSTVNVIAISGDILAADNLEATYDGTGYGDDVAPATQLQITTLAGGIAISTTASSSIVAEGEETLTYTATASHDGTYYEVASDDPNDDIDFYLVFNTGDGANLPVTLHFHGYYEDDNGAKDGTMVIQAYNFNSADWETIYTLTDSASDIDLALPLHVHDVDPDGGNAGDVRIRFNLVTPEVDQNVRIDHLTVGYVTGGLTAAAIVNEWESQSQSDPSGFHVNLMEVEGTDATTYAESRSLAAAAYYLFGSDDVTLANGPHGGDAAVLELKSMDITNPDGTALTIDAPVSGDAVVIDSNNDLGVRITSSKDGIGIFAGEDGIDIAALSRAIYAHGVTEGILDIAEIYDILDDTNALQTDWKQNGRLDLLLDIVLAYWDSLTITGGLLEVVPGSI